MLEEKGVTLYEKLKAKRSCIFLIMICLVECGRYYCVDIVSALQKPIMKTYDIDDVWYNALYSVYAFPNLVFPFLMGYAIDHIGRPLGLLIFVFVVTLGQALLSVSAHQTINSFWLAIVARFLFGCFGKSVAVTQSAYISDWFKDTKLAFALAMTISIARSGTVLNYLIGPPVYDNTHSLAFAFWVGTLMMALSLIACVVTVLLDQGVEISSGYKPQRGPTEKISLRDVCKFSFTFWLVVGSLVGFYTGFLCFVNISAEFAETRFGIDPVSAGWLASTLHLIAALTAPFFGIWIDKWGRRTLITAGSCTLLMAGHLYFAFLPNRIESVPLALVGYIVIGAAYCVFGSASWPMIPYVVEAKAVGTAYGIAFSCENMGSIFGPLILGAISKANRENNTIQYFWVNMFLAGAAALGVLTTLVLIFIDIKQGGILMAVNAAQRQRELQEQQDSKELLDN